MFDDPARDSWQRPHQVIQALALAPDAVVADIGAGTGYFTARIAHMTPGGRVYALDIEPDMIKYLSARAQRENLSNVTPLLARADDPMLLVAVDLALVVDTYHHIGGREAYFRRLKNRLKPAGEVAIIDFTKDSPIGPPEGERLSADDVKREMAQAGYALAAEHKFLPNQYFLVFKPRNR
jgi:SAM-dependent methyltransferase